MHVWNLIFCSQVYCFKKILQFYKQTVFYIKFCSIENCHFLPKSDYKIQGNYDTNVFIKITFSWATFRINRSCDYLNNKNRFLQNHKQLIYIATIEVYYVSIPLSHFYTRPWQWLEFKIKYHTLFFTLTTTICKE